MILKQKYRTIKLILTKKWDPTWFYHYRMLKPEFPKKRKKKEKMKRRKTKKKEKKGKEGFPIKRLEESKKCNTENKHLKNRKANIS